jgi:hypothetical protein
MPLAADMQDGEITVSDRGAQHRNAAVLLLIEPVGLRHGLDSFTSRPVKVDTEAHHLPDWSQIAIF